MVVPYNYALTFIFTFCTSIAVSKISLAASVENEGVVFEAVTLTSAAVMGITIFALTKFRNIDGVEDISMIGPGLSAIGLVFGVTSFFVFAPNKRLGCTMDAATGECSEEPNNMRLLYAALGVCLFALIMLFDTASVIGGKSIMFVLGPETYILGAIQLYLEIINMFVLIMVILGESG
jgi:FtsH-binding integral membrane protein